MSDHDMSKPARLVTFGSTVFFNLEDNFSLYINGEGYQNNHIKLMKFEEKNGITVTKD